ncbi:MAG: hypothetical protein ABSB96_02515 [Gaiellaceae bacterium]
MSEYIRHGENGILLATERAARRSKLVSQLRRSVGREKSAYTISLSDRQDLAGIRAADMEALGRQARADQEDGYANWRKSITSYSSFVCDW